METFRHWHSSTLTGVISVPNAITPYVVTAQPQDALNPEVIDTRIADVEALARWLDYAFELPGGFRFGIAGIIGLIPGIGDVFDALISLYIVLRAIQLRIPRVAVARMLVNVAIEAGAGAVSQGGASAGAFVARQAGAGR